MGGATTTGSGAGLGSGLGGPPQPASKPRAASKTAPIVYGAGDRRVIALFLETRTRLGEDKAGETAIIPPPQYLRIATPDIKSFSSVASPA